MTPPDRAKALLLDEADMARTLDRLARQVAEAFDEPERAALVGLQTRGVHLARRVRERIERFEGVRLPLGKLDATFYRDDVGGFGAAARRPGAGRSAAPPVARETSVPFALTGCHVVLVDDVVYTGRSTRAALDALMDMGRPASVRLLAFIDRGLRELPVAPDFVGRTVPTAPGELVRVRLTEEDGDDSVWLVDADPEAR